MTDQYDPFDIALGARIRARRDDLKITQAQLAQAANVTFQQIQKYERGQNRVTAARLALIANCLQAHPADFFSDQAPAGDGDALTQLRRTHDGLQLAQCFMAMPSDRRSSLVSVAQAMVGPFPIDAAHLAEAA